MAARKPPELLPRITPIFTDALNFFTNLRAAKLPTPTRSPSQACSHPEARNPCGLSGPPAVVAFRIGAPADQFDRESAATLLPVGACDLTPRVRCVHSSGIRFCNRTRSL